MTSDRKAEANCRNSLKSTGPKTPEGKAAVRLNALKHGLLSREVLLPGEDEEALRELGERLRAELQPVGRAGEPPRRPDHRRLLEAPALRSGGSRHIRLGALPGAGRAGG